MPVDITDVDAFTDPIVRPAGADPANAASIQTLAQGLANRTRWLVNLVGGTGGAGEWTYPTARSRTVSIPAVAITSGHSSTDLGAGTVDSAVPITGRWQPYEQPLFGGGPGGSDIFSPSTMMECGAKGVIAYVDLTPHLRGGYTLSTCQVRVDAGTAQGVVANRMLVRLMKRTVSTWAASTAIASSTTTNSAGEQLVSLGLLSEVVDREDTAYWLEIVSSQGANTSADKINAVILGFSDPGPRNF